MDTYDLMKQALSVSATRAKVISSNIANVNTANYKAKKVVFENELSKSEQNLSLETTNKKHIKSDSSSYSYITTDNSSSVTENGNNVDLDVQLSGAATNGLYYKSLVSQLNGRLQMMGYVVEH
ncbi:flagellar basal body rod protein FlgB [Liquorilactobacillus sicerae]|uniref:flagellar basal body rod protein FlgB n=1 Tax=Liquorilactobacillus sicerae TaxID=1416943 RepID=UPI0024814E4F|nr:flagellar basal body rod protein FlgB [Liquorilactobacillus sicerae]